MEPVPAAEPAVPPPGGWNAGFDRVPEEYEALRAAGHMSRRRLEVMSELVLTTSGPVLELGCGTGVLLRRLAARFPDRRFLGIEPLANYVAFAREHAAADGLRNVAFEVGTAEDLAGLVTEPAGVVLSVDALHHVTDVDATVAQVAAVSAPGAHWFALEPNRLHPYVWAYHVLTPGERTFPPRDFLRRASRAGWRLAGRRWLFLFPSGVARVPGWAAGLERRLERVPPLAGGLLLDLVR